MHFALLCIICALHLSIIALFFVASFLVASFSVAPFLVAVSRISVISAPFLEEEIYFQELFTIIPRRPYCLFVYEFFQKISPKCSQIL